MFGYLAFLAPAIFNRGESKDFDCDLTNDHELPEIPSMNAIIISKSRDPGTASILLFALPGKD